MMSENYVISPQIGVIEKKAKVLSKTEMGLICQALMYLCRHDYSSKRKQQLDIIIKKLNALAKGE